MRVVSIILGVTAITAALLFTAVRAEDAASIWIKASPLDVPRAVPGDGLLTQEQEGSVFRSRMSVFADKECADHEYIQEVSGVPIWGCWYDTAFGRLSKAGYGVKPIDKEAGIIDGGSSEFFPTKDPEVFIETPLDMDSGQRSLRFWRVDDMVFSPITPYGNDGPIFYQLPQDKAHIIRNIDGSLYSFDNNLLYGNVWYSENGQYMLISDDAAGYADVFNLEDFSWRRLSVTQGYGAFAISNDGRYVTEAIFDAPPLVIDTKFCDGEACASANLGTLLGREDGYPGFGYLPSFYDNETIGIYAWEAAGNYGEYIIQAPGTYHRKYMAAGESFASGEGASFYTKETAGGGSSVNACHVSNQSYAFLLSRQFGFEYTRNIACSGAETRHMYDRQFSLQPGVEVSDFMAGTFAQLDFVDEGDPDTITVSLGGNDIGFREKIERCVGSTGTCFESYEDRAEIVREINRQYPKLIDVYRALKTEGRQGASVFVIGYPYIIHAGGKCDWQLLTLNTKEITLSKQIIDYLNAVIQRAAASAGVTYVDVSDALAGYRLCEIDNLKAAVNGTTIKQYSFLEYSFSESYHPNTLGHQLLAKVIADTTTRFTQTNPRPTPNLLTPVISDDLPILQDTQKENREIRDRYYARELSPRDEVKPRETVWSFLKGTLYNIMRTMTYTLSIRSDPTFLGEFISDEEGNIELEYSLPDTLEPGFHTLHLTGPGADGMPVDVYKDIYVPEQNRLSLHTPSSTKSELSVEPSSPDPTDSGLIPAEKTDFNAGFQAVYKRDGPSHDLSHGSVYWLIGALALACGIITLMIVIWHKRSNET